MATCAAWDATRAAGAAIGRPALADPRLELAGEGVAALGDHVGSDDGVLSAARLQQPRLAVGAAAAEVKGVVNRELCEAEVGQKVGRADEYGEP